MRIRLVRELNLAALNQKRDKELLLWYCLRAIDLTGHGVIDLAPALAVLIKDFEYSQATAYRLLMGKGFWDIWHRPEADGTTTTRIKIWGLKTVCEYLGAYNLSRHVEMADFPKWGRKALLWSTGAYKPIGVKVNPISRQSLEEKTGIERRKQQRWDQAANTLRRETTAKYQDRQSYKYRPLTQEIVTKNGRYRIKKHLGNIYHSRADRSHRGQLRKVGQALRGRGESFPTAEASTKTSIVRRYFKSVRDFVRAHQKGKAGDEGYYPTKTNPLVYVQCAIW